MTNAVEDNGSFAVMVAAVAPSPAPGISALVSLLGDLEFLMEDLRQRFDISREDTMLASMAKHKVRHDPMRLSTKKN